MTNLSVYLVESADMYPDGPALRCDGTTTTFSELADNAARFAAYLADRGLRPGDRVGVMLANRPEFAMVLYGVLHAGGVAVPIDPRRKAREVEFFLTNTGARLLLFAPSCWAAAAGARAAGVPRIGVGGHTLEWLTDDFLGQAWPVTRAGDDTAVILHTCSTTGVPKGVQLTHSNLACHQAVVARRLLNIGPDDVVLGCLPLWEGFGIICTLLGTMFATATLVLLPRFNAHKALKMIAAQHVTVFEGEADMYLAMLEVADRYELDFGSLRICMSAGAPLPMDALRRFEDRFGCTVLQGYELTGKPGMCFSRSEVSIDGQHER